jgi:hypothetical protein
MGRGWEVRLALLTITLSVWIGFQIGLDRPWPASVFLFVIPAIRNWFRNQGITSVLSCRSVNPPSVNGFRPAWQVGRGRVLGSGPLYPLGGGMLLFE